MEITLHTKDTLVLEDSSWLAKVFLLAFAGAGILLTLTSIKEYGFQAWYRLTHWFGTLMAISGLLVFLKRIFTIRLELSRIYGTVRISQLRGYRWTELYLFDIKDVTELKIERKVTGSREQFRLSIKAKGDWIPIQKSFSNDFSRIEQAAKVLQVMLDE
ncbi:MAG: hypothetical protein NWR72_18785 [Bacteroidia bacterium]|nr:hypothetical protein [Bacteroidia bacterium]